MSRSSAMREPTYFVLASLLGGPLHGYAIIKRADELSGGRVRLATGTLYTALDRLTAEGHVQLVSEETVGGRIDRDLLDLTEGALGERRERADAFDLVAEELDAERLAAGRRSPIRKR